MGVGAGLYMCDVVKKKFTFAISSPDEFLSFHHTPLAVGRQARAHANSPLPDSAYCLPQFLQRAAMLALQALY